MIKCPNCGSTAQPKLNTPPSIYKKGELIITTHKCGCGCVFERRYQLSEVRMISNEKVEEYPTSLLAQGMIKKMREYYSKQGSE